MGVPTSPAVLSRQPTHVVSDPQFNRDFTTKPRAMQKIDVRTTLLDSPIVSSVPFQQSCVGEKTSQFQKNPRGDSSKNQSPESMPDTKTWETSSFSQRLPDAPPAWAGRTVRILSAFADEAQAPCVSEGTKSSFVVDKHLKSPWQMCQHGTWAQHTSGHSKRKAHSSTSVKVNLTWCG